MPCKKKASCRCKSCRNTCSARPLSQGHSRTRTLLLASCAVLVRRLCLCSERKKKSGEKKRAHGGQKKRGTENTVQKESELTKEEREDKFTGDSSTCLGTGKAVGTGERAELGKEGAIQKAQLPNVGCMHERGMQIKNKSQRADSNHRPRTY